MSVQAGQLLIVRRRLTLSPGLTTIDTGIRQANVGVQPDPPMGGEDPDPVTLDPGIASRIQVQPLFPIDPWVDNGLQNGEPRIDIDTGTVVVDFSFAGAEAIEVNVMFWDPHTLISPVNVDTYLTLICSEPEVCILGVNGEPFPADPGDELPDPGA